MIQLVDDQPKFHAAISAVHRAAFGGEFEAALVERLRRDGLVLVSLVALDADEVVGHILFSDLSLEIDGTPIAAASLAPMGVHPHRQRQGIGSLLVRAGLERLRQRHIAAAVVVGHPDYYPRFGFSADLARKLASPYAGEACMALELIPHALAGYRGSVHYPAAFDAN
jgi:putative acetyltransferase